MNRFILLFLIGIISCSNNRIDNNESIKKRNVVTKVNQDTCVDYNSLNIKIRDGIITKQLALKEIQSQIPKTRKYYYSVGGHDYKKSEWRFPVEGYNINSIGGENGSGYISTGYDYFDGNKHGGHPAIDIFIFDRNQDCIDDSKKKLINVLSMTGGIVIASEDSWDTTSNLRGGKYIWIYDPSSNSFFYYAHNSKIFVKPCDIIKPGDTIATIGRTGLNAYKKRSPTHLHLMQLELDSINYPRPINCYSTLTKIKIR